MEKPLIVSHLSRSFDDFKAVDDLSFSVEQGEIFGFLGPNGAGKTTTIKMITGLLSPDQGQVSIYGFDPFKDEVEVKRLIGVVPENLQMYDRLSARELVEFSARMHGIASQQYQPLMEHLFEQLELEDKADNQILDYSHGMKKKTALISALIHQPRILFLDEPFTGMDAVSVIRVRHLLEGLKEQGVCIFFSSHILELVEKLCDRIGIIVHSRLLGMGDKQELKQRFKGRSLEEVLLNIPVEQAEQKSQGGVEAGHQLSQVSGEVLAE